MERIITKNYILCLLSENKYNFFIPWIKRNCTLLNNILTQIYMCVSLIVNND